MACRSRREGLCRDSRSVPIVGRDTNVGNGTDWEDNETDEGAFQDGRWDGYYYLKEGGSRSKQGAMVPPGRLLFKRSIPWIHESSAWD